MANKQNCRKIAIFAKNGEKQGIQLCFFIQKQVKCSKELKACYTTRSHTHEQALKSLNSMHVAFCGSGKKEHLLCVG